MVSLVLPEHSLLLQLQIWHQDQMNPGLVVVGDPVQDTGPQGTVVWGSVLQQPYWGNSACLELVVASYKRKHCTLFFVNKVLLMCNPTCNKHPP